MQGYARCLVTCSMTLSPAKQDQQCFSGDEEHHKQHCWSCMQGYARCVGYLFHDHDCVEEARASNNAARHEVGAAHLALQMQIRQLIHLQTHRT